MLPWNYMLPFLINQAVVMNHVNGDVVQGKLCRYDERGIDIIVLMDESQFVTRHYLYGQVQNLTPFPSCFAIPTPY